MVLLILLLVLSIEATTNIISKSEIFKPLRKYLFNRSSNRGVKFVHDLIDCPYCTSVWISLSYICVLFILFKVDGLGILYTIMLIISLHRLSNILHHLIDRIDKNYGYELPTDTENEK